MSTLQVECEEWLEQLGEGPEEARGLGVGGVLLSAVKRSIGFTITEKAPFRAFSWLKATNIAFTFKTLC